MGDKCGEVHPDTGWVCGLKSVTHKFHACHAGSWRNEDWAGPNAPAAKPAQTKSLLALAGQITRPAPSTGPPSEAVAAWSREDWVAQTKTALRAFLVTRTEPFTTAEDFWPQVDAPDEHSMRAMVQPVQYALKQCWMVEVEARRLRGIYTTRNGIQFSMNKLVPVYRSLLTG